MTAGAGRFPIAALCGSSAGGGDKHAPGGWFGGGTQMGREGRLVKRLRQKLHSQDGVSLLLALLFFLLCGMVAASVLTAAASNAGKLRGSYEEQQKYLALSSALRLVAGQLEQAVYEGCYTVCTWEVTIVDEEDQTITTRYYHIRQQPGSFDCGSLHGVLSFQRKLDGLFSREFNGIACAPLPKDTPPSSYTLSVTAEGGDAAFLEKFPDITIEAAMDENRRIHLTAVLEETEDRAYRMEAELSAQGAPAIEFSPAADQFPHNAPPGDAHADTRKTQPVTWKLDWIDRGVEA